VDEHFSTVFKPVLISVNLMNYLQKEEPPMK